MMRLPRGLSMDVLAVVLDEFRVDYLRGRYYEPLLEKPLPPSALALQHKFH